MRFSTILGIILAFSMIGVGIKFPMPEKYVSVGYGYDHKWTDDKGSEYVGGDAYNYQMEASLKAGWVAGVMALKTICINGGIFLLVFCIASNEKSKKLDEQTEVLRTILIRVSEKPTEKTTNTTEINNNLPTL